MSSSITYEKCKCGGILTTDFNCRTFEQYSMCDRCGYLYSYELKRDDNYKAVFDENNKPIYIEQEKEGYGCACFWTKNGFGQIHHFNEPITKEIEDEFYKVLEDENIDKNKSYLLSYDKATNFTRAIYGKIPLSHNELEEL